MTVGSKRIIVGLVAVQVADGIFNAIPTQWLREDLDHLGFPWRLRHVFPVIKVASAAGLLGGLRWPRLGRITSGALIVYFMLGTGFHLRAKDGPLRWWPAAAMFGWSALALRTYQGGTELQPRRSTPARYVPEECAPWLADDPHGIANR